MAKFDAPKPVSKSAPIAPASNAPASDAPASNAPASNAPASNAPASNAPASDVPWSAVCEGIQELIVAIRKPVSNGKKTSAKSGVTRKTYAGPERAIVRTRRLLKRALALAIRAQIGGDDDE